MEAQDLEGLIGEPLDKRVSKILVSAPESGWNPHPVTMVARFSKEQFLPFFMTWVLNPETMRWRFAGSRVALVRPGFSGKLTQRDALLYMAHPEVIQEKEAEVSPWTTTT